MQYLKVVLFISKWVFTSSERKKNENKYMRLYDN